MYPITSRSLRVALTCIAVAAVGAQMAGLVVGIVGGVAAGALAWLVPVAKTTISVRRAPSAVARSGLALVRAEEHPRVVITTVQGPLTFLARGSIIRELDGPPWPTHAILDLTAVRTIDAGGLAEVADVVAFLSARNTETLVAASSSIRERLVAAKLADESVLKMFATVEEALDSAIGRRVPEAASPALTRAAGWS